MAERCGATTRKFDACACAGAAPRPRSSRPATARVERSRSSRRRATTEPVTWPPVSGRVVEALLDRGRRLGVVGEHHVVPGLVALLTGPSVLLQLREQVGVGRLAAAAGAEDRADERGHGDHVVDRRRRLVDAVRRPVGVDAVGVGLGVGDDLAALGAVVSDEQLALLGDERLGRGARHERLAAGDEREGVDVGHVGDGGPRRSAAELEQEAAVARRRPAGAEGDVGAGLAVDVRDPVGVVDQPQPGPAGLLLVWSRRSAAKFSGRK